MLMRYLVCVFVFLSGCGHKDVHQQAESHTDLQSISTILDTYKQLAPKGWDVSSGCDALLFTSLQAVGQNEEFDIEAAQGEPGQWFRKPAQVQDHEICSSDISRDMFHGLLTYALKFQKLQLVEDIWTYGSQHNWKMGQERKIETVGPITGKINNRTIMTPQMIGLLAEVIHALGGKDHAERHYRALEVYNVQPGFTSHLTLLKIYLRGAMYNALEPRDMAALLAISAHMNNNPLVHALIHGYTDGDQSRAVSLLLDTWPADRLPTNRDWSEEWRLQRSDDDTGLQPGDSTEEHSHSGGDFMFVANLLLTMKAR